jgi:hypothetical protein
MSLNNLSINLADAGRRQEAMLSGNEAAEAYAECRRQGWVRYQKRASAGGQAGSLSNPVGMLLTTSSQN